MKYDSIEAIIRRLDEIIKNKARDPKDILGSYIVGCTIALDDIEQYYKKYSVLEEIAELGSDLEIETDEKYQDELLKKIQTKLSVLKSFENN